MISGQAFMWCTMASGLDFYFKYTYSTDQPTFPLFSHTNFLDFPQDFCMFFPGYCQTVMRHRLSGLSTYGLKGQCAGDEHPAYNSAPLPIRLLSKVSTQTTWPTEYHSSPCIGVMAHRVALFPFL